MQIKVGIENYTENTNLKRGGKILCSKNEDLNKKSNDISDKKDLSCEDNDLENDKVNKSHKKVLYEEKNLENDNDIENDIENDNNEKNDIESDNNEENDIEKDNNDNKVFSNEKPIDSGKRLSKEDENNNSNNVVESNNTIFLPSTKLIKKQFKEKVKRIQTMKKCVTTPKYLPEEFISEIYSNRVEKRIIQKSYNGENYKIKRKRVIKETFQEHNYFDSITNTYLFVSIGEYLTANDNIATELNEERVTTRLCDDGIIDITNIAIINDENRILYETNFINDPITHENDENEFAYDKQDENMQFDKINDYI